MLVDNRAIFRSLNSALYNRLVELENREALSTIIVEPSRQGETTLAILKDGKPVYIHSKYDPKKEVQSFVDSVQDLTETKHIFVIGIGLGYHLEQLLKHYPKLKVTLFEPNIEILYNYVSTNKLSKNIEIIFTKLEEVQNAQQIEKNFSEVTATLIWPSYLRIYEDEIKKMQEQLVQNLNSTKRSLVTNIAFQTRWIANSLLNFPALLKSSNIITEKYYKNFKNKPVILVAAGPSLSDEIENIRTIIDEGSAYVFAVGSGVNALINRDIIPHAVFSYDPTHLNQTVLQKIKDQHITNLPLIFGSSVGYESIQEYPSPMLHMITSADTVNKNLLKIQPLQTIEDSPSIAVMALQVVKKLNMNPIIFAGQNLGFLNNTRYSKEIEYSHVVNELSETELKNSVTTKDVNGKEMLSTDGLLNMKSSLEIIIQKYPYGHVYNTTKHGAHIEGTEFRDLLELIKEVLHTKNIVLTDWVVNEEEYIDGKEQFNKLFEDFRKMTIHLDKAVQIANQLKRESEKGIYSKVSALINEFNKVFKRVADSETHEYIIKSAIKVQSKKFFENFKKVEHEKNLRKKAELFLDITYAYLGHIYETAEKFYPIMKKVQSDLSVKAMEEE